MEAIPGRRLTQWASRYGPAAEGMDFSGYTPADLAFPKYVIGNTTEAARMGDIEIIEEFQRTRLYGFTTRELGDLDCLPTRELAPSDLKNPIIPLLRRDRWEVIPIQPDFTRTNLYPLKNGRGNWIAANDEVWKILKPVLILASRMLMSSHNLPWVSS
jgi:hypothetical protein